MGEGQKKALKQEQWPKGRREDPWTNDSTQGQGLVTLMKRLGGDIIHALKVTTGHREEKMEDLCQGVCLILRTFSPRWGSSHPICGDVEAAGNRNLVITTQKLEQNSGSEVKKGWLIHIRALCCLSVFDLSQGGNCFDWGGHSFCKRYFQLLYRNVYKLSRTLIPC